MNRQQVNRLAIGLITGLALLVVVPIVLVILFVFYNGISAISWEFLYRVAHQRDAGGRHLACTPGHDFSDLWHSHHLLSLAVGAAIYLSEYAADNRLTRMVRLAIVNLAGIPSHRLRAVRPGRVRTLYAVWHVDSGRFPHPGHPHPASGHQHGRGGHRIGPPAVPHGRLKPGCDPLADHPPPGAPAMPSPASSRGLFWGWAGQQARRRRSCLL